MSSTYGIIDACDNPNDEAIRVAETNAYHALSTAFGPPAQMASSGPELLTSAFSCFDKPLRVSGRQAADAWQTALLQSDSLAIAYARLFLGPFEILAPPYASFYLEPSQKIMGDVSRYAANAYAEAGLLPHPGSHDAPDHICRELEFMYFLAFRQMATDEPNWTVRQQRFWSEHLRHWLPAFCDGVVQANVHPFYNSIATLLAQFADVRMSQ